MKPEEAVGQRIAKARDFLGLTQATVAELYRYAEILSRPLDYFLGLGVWQEDTDFRPQFRLMAEKLDALATGPPRRPGRPKAAPEASPDRLALMKFEALCRNYLELERANALPRQAMPELPAPRRFSVQEAEQLAATVRAHLDIGNDAPIQDLRVRLEDAFALRVFVLKETGRLLSAAFHQDKVGGCVLLADQPVPKMRFALAHALGYLLANREEAMVDVVEPARRTAVDGFASAFAAALLMPSRGLRERFGSVHSEASDVNEIALLYLARTFGVTLRALCARLETLRLVSSSSLERIGQTLREAGPGPESEGAAPSPTDQPRWEMFPERYVFLAIRAYRKELISRARFAECLLTTESDTALKVLLYVTSVADRQATAKPGAPRTS